jgi:hypothetical protein
MLEQQFSLQACAAVADAVIDVGRIQICRDGKRIIVLDFFGNRLGLYDRDFAGVSR